MTRSDSRLQRAYASDAHLYDRTRFVPMVEAFTAAALLKLVHVGRGTRALDVGAGTGRLAVPLAEAGATVVALDLTPEMLALTRSKAEARGLRNLHLGRANARKLPFREHSFDVAVSGRFLHLFDFDDQLLLLREMHRVLKPDGVLLVEHANRGAVWAGGFAAEVLLRFRGRKSRGRVDRRQIDALYRGHKIIKRQGLSWPLIGTVARLSPWLANMLLRLSLRDGFGNFTRTVWVVSAREDSSNRSGSAASRVPAGGPHG